MAKKSAKPKPVKAVPFESALEQLKEIVSELENGNLTLSDSLEKYEQGVKNLKDCYQALEQAQKKIELLVKLDDNGNLVTRPFDDTATKQPARQLNRQADVVDLVDENDDCEEDEKKVLAEIRSSVEQWQAALKA